MKYIVMEIQVFADGMVSTPTYAYDTRADAESKYHDIASKAVKSALPTHTVMFFTSDGIKCEDPKAYHHPVEVVEEAVEE